MAQGLLRELEGEHRQLADHQQGQYERQHQISDERSRSTDGQPEGRNGSRSTDPEECVRGDGESEERGRLARVVVEFRQAQCSKCHDDEDAIVQIIPCIQALQSTEDKGSGSQAKAHDVGQRVEILPDRRGHTQQARYHPIEEVKDSREDDEPHGDIGATCIEREDDSHHTREEVPRGQHIRYMLLDIHSYYYIYV